jgi:3-deoxy-7-phosphoheptulonate synthase
MVIFMEKGVGEDDLARVIERLEALGFESHQSSSTDRVVIGAVGADAALVDARELEILPGVKEVVKISKPYKLVSRSFQEEDTLVRVGDVTIGGSDVVLMAGPCGVESEEQIHIIAEHVARAGAKVLRGGAFKPRSSPYSFQGLGGDGLRYLRAAADANGLKTVSEVMDPSQIELMSEYVDIFQVGARNMQNFSLLKALGRQRNPVLLKRGMSATMKEWLMSAEYVMAGGNRDVILCERGIRTFENQTRNTFDVSAFPIVQQVSHLPVIGDPSHAIGYRDKVAPLARAAVAAGADGLIVEVHHKPEEALSDGPQALRPEQFEALVAQLRHIAPALDRAIA